jgi:uncharacterized LabA/DUF88 family protein
MTFIDGENLCIRGQNWLSARSIALVEGRYYVKDAFLWLAFPHAYNYPKGILGEIPTVGVSDGHHIIRSSYYTSVSGDDTKVSRVKELIWEKGLQPTVFKKARKEAKAKGVDIALTKDMLSHAFMGNYDTAVLVAGDGDYIPLVEEVKRSGKRVVLHFFQSGLSEDLKLTCDAFVDVSNAFEKYWKLWRDPETENAIFP